MYFDTHNQRFVEKMIKLTVIIMTDKGQKVAGHHEFDLSNYSNSQHSSKDEEALLNKCPDKKAKIFFKVETDYIE